MFIGMEKNIMENGIKMKKEKISDGYHTFEELYEHRHIIFIALCKNYKNKVWRSKLHLDGSNYAGWFILGINKEKGKQITYHLPINKWKETSFTETLKKAPEFDGHSPKDVINRIKKLKNENR